MTIPARPVDHRRADDFRRQEELFRREVIPKQRFDQAINHMSHGLSMFGPDERLIVCNAQYLKIYGLDPAIAKPGISSRANS